MLVLSRKANEEVMIGSEIRVTVLKVGGGKVKLGFTAPSDVAIHRREICRTEPQTESPPPGREPRRRSPNGVRSS